MQEGHNLYRWFEYTILEEPEGTFIPRINGKPFITTVYQTLDEARAACDWHGCGGREYTIEETASGKFKPLYRGDRITKSLCRTLKAAQTACDDHAIVKTHDYLPRKDTDQ